MVYAYIGSFIARRGVLNVYASIVGENYLYGVISMLKKTLVVLSTFLFLFSMLMGSTEALSWEDIRGDNILKELLNQVVNLINRVNSMIQYIRNIPSKVVNAISGTFGMINARITQIYTYLTGLPSLILEQLILLPDYVIGVFIGLFGYIENMIYSLSDIIENSIPSNYVFLATPIAISVYASSVILIVSLIPRIMDYVPFL